MTVLTVGTLWYWRQREDDIIRTRELHDGEQKQPIVRERNDHLKKEEEKKEEAEYVCNENEPGAPILEIQTRSISIPNSEEKEEREQKPCRILAPNTITIAHGSVTGTCSKLAQDLFTCLQEKNLDHDRVIQMGCLEEWDWWDELLNYEEEDDRKNNEASAVSRAPSLPVLLLLLPTHHGGSWPLTGICLKGPRARLWKAVNGNPERRESCRDASRPEVIITIIIPTVPTGNWHTRTKRRRIVIGSVKEKQRDDAN